MTDQIAAAPMLAVARILKDRFPNLGVIEILELTEQIVQAVVPTYCTKCGGSHVGSCP